MKCVEGRKEEVRLWGLRPCVSRTRIRTRLESCIESSALEPSSSSAPAGQILTMATASKHGMALHVGVGHSSIPPEKAFRRLNHHSSLEQDPSACTMRMIPAREPTFA